MKGPAAHLDSLNDAGARSALLRCCGSKAWVEGMMRRRPFRDDNILLQSADQVWNTLSANDWLEAFASHPRIGERPSPSHGSAAAWASAEQSGTSTAAAETARALAQGNTRYESKFGHVFLVCATGKSADEMLEALNIRLNHDAETELRIAAGEQAKITRLRLHKLVQP